jgi:hypothetical protein
MKILRSIFQSIYSCFDGIFSKNVYISSKSRSFFGNSGGFTREDIKKLQIEAELAASIVRLQYETAEIQLSLKKNSENAALQLKSGASDSEMFLVYRRTMEIQLQLKTVRQALNFLLVTKENNKQNERMQHISQVVSSAVERHKVMYSEENGNPNEILLSCYNDMSQSMANTANVLEEIDMHMQDSAAEGMSQENNEIGSNSEFSLWKSSLLGIKEPKDDMALELQEKHIEKMTISHDCNLNM